MNIQHKNTYGLLACVFALAVLCVLSVSSPMRFEHQQQIREKTVKERLVKIRTAEEKYRLRYGVYTADFGNLVKSGLLADSLQYIPYSDGKRFSIDATTTIAKSGRQNRQSHTGRQRVRTFSRTEIWRYHTTQRQRR